MPSLRVKVLVDSVAGVVELHEVSYVVLRRLLSCVRRRLLLPTAAYLLRFQLYYFRLRGWMLSLVICRASTRFTFRFVVVRGGGYRLV